MNYFKYVLKAPTSIRPAIFVTLLCLFVLLCFFVLSGQKTDLNSPSSEDLPQVPEAQSRGMQPELAVEPAEQEEAPEPAFNYPVGAVEGELVVHFKDRQAYLDYLQRLRDAGLEPLGQLDALLALRLSEASLRRVRLQGDLDRISFSYPVFSPPPPSALSPLQLGGLQPFDTVAAMIAGEWSNADGSGVRVAILDSGFQAHSDFSDSQMTSLDFTGTGVDGLGSGHGTSVASIIGGRLGIAPGAELLPIRVLDEQGQGNSYDLARAIIAAVDEGADIINMSLGLYQDVPVLHEAILYAGERDVLMVAAAGNDGYGQIAYPAAYSQVLSVTAVDARGQQARFPNQSDTIDFAAPGFEVVAAAEDGAYVRFSGTSAAAPFVTATLAVLISEFASNGGDLSVDVLKGYLNDAGAPGVDPVYGAGTIDWQRLSERNTPGVYDLAVADLYLPADSQAGTTLPIEVLVQNRGTSRTLESQLEVQIIGVSVPQRFTIGALAPGEVTSRKVYTQVPASRNGESLNLVARIMPAANDVRPENDAKAVRFKALE